MKQSATTIRRSARILVAAAVAASSVPSVARASGQPQPLRAADGLSTPVSFTGSGDTATAIRTEEIRSMVPAPANPRILMIGTGVARNLFPSTVTTHIAGAPASLVDQHGYGTLAASTILQLSAGARVTSQAISSSDSTWHLVNLGSLAAALENAYTNRDAHDAILLAFPPNGALDPLAHLTGHASYPGFGQGDALLAEALLAARGDVRMRGIPLDDADRDRVFAGINARQRDAVERYVARARQWTRVVKAIRALTGAGVSVVAPAGDLTKTGRDGDVAPLPHQTIYGVAALPEVLTVGSAYSDNPAPRLGAWRTSPTSGRGPTLQLGMKPDLVAPSDIVGMLPVSATLAWPDDSLRRPTSLLQWAQGGTLPSPCPSPTRAYRCVLQASSMVSAAVVATNIAATVNRGIPNPASNRSPSDDEYLRGFAWAAADEVTLTHPASPAADPLGGKPLPPGDIPASPFEQGAGLFLGFGDRDPRRLPIALAPASAGEIGYRGDPVKISVPVVEAPAAPTPRLTHALGPAANGASVLRSVRNGPVSATGTADGVNVVTKPAARHGGVWAGTLALTSPDGGTSRIPLSFIQDVPFRFHADYAYNELMAGGAEGERVEDASVILMAGLPTNVGLVGEGFKVLGAPAHRNTGGDPLHNVIVRTGRAASQFRNPSLPAREHGRGIIDAVPPGFYRFHLLSDHSVEAIQESGTPESLGIGLGSFGPDGFTSPASAILISGESVCDETSADGCLADDPAEKQIDEQTGFCVARNEAAKVQFGVYCGEVAYAVPGAVVTRAVHLVSRDEWQACTVSLEANGSVTSFTDLVGKTEDCRPVEQAQTTNGKSLTNPTGATPVSGGVGLPGSAWTLDDGAASCLAPSERVAYPNGHPNDITATFSPVPGLATDRVPSLVLSTTVPLPYLNTYTTATLTTAYEADGAIVVTRFDAGPSRTADASHSVLTLADLGTNGARRTGTYTNEWAVMSANAPQARMSIVAFPTSATSTSRVALCDVALRVATFAKQAYGDRVAGATPDVPSGPNLRTHAMLDRGLSAAITPARARVRAIFSGSSFGDGGSQREDLVVAAHIPKNTTADRSVTNHIRSPWGGPAVHDAIRRWGTDAKRHEVVRASGMHDPKRGQTSLRCGDGTPACTAWNAARDRNAILDALSPDLFLNGRFNGVAVAGHSAVVAAKGNLAFDTAMATDDKGAFTTRWSPGTRFPVADFSTQASETATVEPLDPVVQVVRDAAGHAVVTIRGTLPGGAPAVVSAILD